uniref:Uncharacterized protein n=1 Tax=viral metagenome TaxID=1070528 RepID=A0A6C0I6W1_9ZZZZ
MTKSRTKKQLKQLIERTTSRGTSCKILEKINE